MGKRSRILTVRGPVYFAPGDEKAFFDWLLSIPCVSGVRGDIRNLHVTVSGSLSAMDMRELSALLRRYRMPLKVLEPFKTAKNVKWIGPRP